MSSRARPPEGPDAKTPAWRAGSFFLAWGVLLFAAEVLSGGLFRVPMLLLLTLLVLGLALSMGYGLSWMAGTTKDATSNQYLAHELPGQQGATYIVLQKDAVKPKNPKRDYSGGWLVAHSLLWRVPVTMGDSILAFGWSFAGRVQGRDKTIAGYHADLEAFNKEEEREKYIGRDF
jgi:hypothetical protein